MIVIHTPERISLRYLWAIATVRAAEFVLRRFIIIRIPSRSCDPTVSLEPRRKAPTCRPFVGILVDVVGVRIPYALERSYFRMRSSVQDALFSILVDEKISGGSNKERDHRPR